MIECYKNKTLRDVEMDLSNWRHDLEYFKAMEDTYEDKITQNIEQKRKKW